MLQRRKRAGPAISPAIDCHAIERHGRAGLELLMMMTIAPTQRLLGAITMARWLLPIRNICDGSHLCRQ